MLEFFWPGSSKSEGTSGKQSREGARGNEQARRVTDVKPTPETAFHEQAGLEEKALSRESNSVPAIEQAQDSPVRPGPAEDRAPTADEVLRTTNDQRLTTAF